MKRSTIYKLQNFFVFAILLFFFSPQLKSQSPGGVSLTQELWLKADQVQASGTPTDGQSISLWHDWSGNNRDHVQNGTNTLPTFVTFGDLMNFQPALNFDGSTNTKLVGPDFSVKSTLSYYIFYVSRLKEGTTGVATLYSLNAGRNNYSGWSAGNPYFTTGNATANVNTNSNGKNYGINAVIRPNGTLLSQYSYFNGVSQSFTGRAMLTTSGQSVIGNANLTTANPFYGDIQEIIVFSAPQNTLMTDTDLQKVYSYLSIKYGIPLEAAASQTMPNYLNSNGDIIWDGSQDTTYQNYVFGIGRDDAGSLYQKQSVNYDKPVVAVFTGDDLTTLNANSTGVLTDNTFMLLGSNGLEGLKRYEYAAGQVFANGSLSEKINFKHNAVLKAKTFNQASFTVNMKTYLDTKYILVCPDENFDPSNTRIYSVTDDIAKSVLVNNGDYISFALVGAKPGGVDLLTELWLKADIIPGTTTDSTAVTTWQDVSVFGRDHTQSGTISTPLIRNKSNLMNYHSHLQFNTYSALTASSYLDSSKSYYMFYVSEVTNTTAASILYAFNSSANVNNNNQGWYMGSPSFTDGGYAAANFKTHTNPQGKTYGIVAVERTNSADVQQRLTFNGITQSFSGSVLAGIGTGESLIGARRAGNYLPFLGNLQEIIVVSGDAGVQMTDLQLLKINSYLAVKYGITLDPSSQPNYISSDGTVIWNGSTNTGYQNNIFGIGRDDNSSLYQKQSSSYDKDIMTVFVGNEIQNLNIDNTGTINNEEFLMFGSNSADGESLSSYDYKQNTQFANMVLPSDINYKNDFVLKAQVTGSTGFQVKIQLNTAAKYVLVSSDETFTPANTRIYEVNNKIAEDVQINNGDYVGLALYSFAPGGVINGLRLWLRADDSNSLENDGNNNILTWKDQTSNENDYNLEAVTYGAKIAPVYTPNDIRMNFFPSLFFDRYAYLATKTGPMRENAPDNSTSFIVYNSTSYVDNARTYTHGFGSTRPDAAASRMPAVGFAPLEGSGRISVSGTGGGLYNGTVKGFNLGATALHMVRLRKDAAEGGRLVEHDFGGLSDQLTTGLGAGFGNSFAMANGGTLGGASIASGTFIGLMSEIFFYERELTEVEKSRIRTYLGMKYAITLYATGSTDTNKLPFDYVLSNSTTTVWPGASTPYSAYHKNVAGLVRDDNSNLFVNKSRSTDTDATITMIAGESVTDGQGTSSNLANDQSGLFWGNNGATGTTVYSESAKAVCGDLESRMNRIWLVNKANLTSQKVVVRAGDATSFEYDNKYKVYMLVASSESDITSDNWSQAIPGEWINGEVQFNYTFTDDNTYITFGGVAEPGVCTSCTFSGYKTIDFTKVWTRKDRGVKSKTVDLGDGFSANIAVTDSSNVLRNGYPRSYRKTLQLLRRGNSTTDTKAVTTTISFTGGAAAASFELYDVDRQSQRLDDIEVYGLCGGGVVKPKLTYSMDQKRSSYVISSNTATSRAAGSYTTSSYLNRRGRLQVNFSSSVEQIVIVYKEKYNSKATGNQMIGIGPLTLYCPQPLQINEDGLALTMQASDSVKLCDEVPYTFRVTNTNCASKEVNLSETLPEGMYWVAESVSVEEGTGTPVINTYENTAQLSIQNIEVPGASTITVTGTARFTQTATAGSYSSRASITYKNSSNEDVTYQSCDLLAGCGNTTVQALESVRLDPVTVDKISADLSCISDDGTAKVTIQITNPNTALDYVTLSVNISDSFTYVDASLSSSPATLGGTTTYEEGALTLEDFTLPNGTSTITFQIKAPETLPTDVESLELGFDLVTESDMECVYIDTTDTEMDFVLPFCTYCTQDPNTDPATVMSMVGVSSQRNGLETWPDNIPNGFIVLESNDKGLVITRTVPANIPQDQWVEGMIIYDTTDKCIKLYNGTEWKCIERSCNE
ncbi:hypothetical protein [Apibacter sp. HY039]|uniref:hypothetical protein n=1 Tax=Apibacter sp. HY039 TaxID=2501476 RepID=UPI000FEB76BF|nr:hypothetical protein [Apibacter sp. HY039]